MRQRRLDLICLGVLALVVAAFFWPLLLGGQSIPHGGGDLVSFLWPLYRFAARSLRAGELPLWNPYLYSGAPFIADNQTGVFYPINLVVFALFGEPSYAVMEGLVVFHVWLAAAAMFALLRGLELRRPAALFGGVAFALSDLFVTHIGNLNLNATAAWLPLLLLAAHRAWTRRSRNWAAGAGVVLAVAALAGHGQMLLFLALALALLLLYRLAADRKQGWRRALETVGLAAVIAIVGMGGAALVLLPSYEMAEHTARGQLAFDEAIRYSLPPKALVGLVAPGFYGRGAAHFWGAWDRVEVGYAGIATLVMALMSLPWVLRRDRRPFAFFALLALLAFLLAMGGYTPLYQLVYRFVPTFDQVRAPARLIVLGDLGLAVLAAVGLDRLLRARVERRGQVVGILALAAAGLALLVGLPAAHSLPLPERVRQAETSVLMAAGLLAVCGLLMLLACRVRWAGWLLLPLLAADLIWLGSTLEVDRNDPTVGFKHADLVAFLQRDTGFFRIEAAAGAWQPDAALVHGLYDIGGIYNPLALAPYDAYRWAVGERAAPLYNLLGAKYVLAGKGAPPGDGRLVPVYTANPAIDVYLNTSALPRALLVFRSEVVPDHTAAWNAIHEPGFDPAQVAVLEKGVPLNPGQVVGQSRLTFLRYELNRVELSVQTPADGILLLTDVFYPGWRATVDGRPAELLRADYVFRAVRIPAGEHVVRMDFRPRTWQVGFGISLVTWLALAAVAAREFRRRKAACPPDDTLNCSSMADLAF